MPKLDHRTLITITILALIGALGMLRATRFGVGVSPDSVVYLDAARNLAAGHGLVAITGTTPEPRPLTHYPPLYSSLLALISKTGVVAEIAARWLNAILFAANVFLVGFVVASFARDSYWVPVCASLLALTAADVLAAHSFALSEPLYLFLLLMGLLFLSAYFENQQRRFLLASAFAIALSTLTRYVGVAAILSGVTALLILDGQNAINKNADRSRSTVNSRRNVPARVIDAALFGIIACAPTLLWTIRNRLAGGNALDRQFVFHPIKFSQLVSALSAVAQWLLLGKVRGDVRAIAFLVQLIVFAGFVIYLMRADDQIRNANKGEAKLPHLLVILIFFHLAFLIFTASFVDADTVFDSRSLLPVHFATLILALCVAHGLYRRSLHLSAARYAFGLLALLFVCSYGVRGFRWLTAVQADGQGYASRAWKDSATIAFVKNAADDSIYSNGYDAIYYLTGRCAFYLPEKIVHGTGRPNPHYEEELKKMASDLREHNGEIVYFNTLAERSAFLPSENELTGRLPLMSRKTADATLYFIDTYSIER